MGTELADTDIASLAVFITFGTKNFLDDSALATKPEVVGLIASKADTRVFASGGIRDSDFVRRSVVLVSDRDVTSDLVRVDLQLE